MEFDFQLEPVARLPSDQGLWFGTGQTAWPIRAKFETRLLVGRSPLQLDFVRRLAIERHVRAELVVQPRNQTPMIPLLKFSIRGILGLVSKWSSIKSWIGVIERSFVAVS